LSVLLHAPSSRSRGGQPRHVRPARAPRDRALLQRLPGAERATGVLPQLANRGVRRGVQLRRPPHHRAVRDGDDDALPNAATGCEAQAMEEHAAEDIKHFRPTTVRLLPPDLCPSASLTGAMPRSGEASRAAEKAARGADRAAAEARAASARRRLRRRTPHWGCAQQPAHCRVAARAGGWSVRVLVVRVACRLELGEKFILASRGGKGPQPWPWPLF